MTFPAAAIALRLSHVTDSPITGLQPLWHHSCYLAIIVVYIEFAWNYEGLNSIYYYFMRITQLWKSLNYANKSLNYSSVGDSWIPVWFGNWNKTRTNFFVKMGKSSSNVPNVFKCSSLTITTSVDIQNCTLIFIAFCNISSFTAHIQRFWTQITNSEVFVEIFIFQKWVFLPSWHVRNMLTVFSCGLHFSSDLM